jgi:hypothetical protein
MKKEKEMLVLMALQMQLLVVMILFGVEQIYRLPSFKFH